MSDFWYLLRFYDFLLQGLRWTIAISFLAVIGGTLTGLVVGLARMAPFRPMSAVAGFYISFFQSTPLLVQLIWIYYALPILIGKSLSGPSTAVLSLSLYSGSFVAEIVRAGILSIGSGQVQAALALGMTPLQSLRRVVLPQAVVRMLPPLAGTLVALIKDSALTSAAAVPELMYQTEALASFSLRRVETYTITALIYLALTYPLALVANWLHRRLLPA